MKIGQVSKLSGLPVKTIRFYCDQGLIEPARRSESGYRLFHESVLAELQLIRSLRELDMPLEELRAVLQVRRSGVCNCSSLKSGIRSQIDAINHKIADLDRLGHQLSDLLASWTDCGGVKEHPGLEV